jgi:hypothetical protein
MLDKAKKGIKISFPYKVNRTTSKIVSLMPHYIAACRTNQIHIKY